MDEVAPMLKHKRINSICWIAAAVALALTGLYLLGNQQGWIKNGFSLGYEERLFAAAEVHTIYI